jgi:hypothetical protein
MTANWSEGYESAFSFPFDSADSENENGFHIDIGSSDWKIRHDFVSRVSEVAFLRAVVEKQFERGNTSLDDEAIHIQSFDPMEFDGPQLYFFSHPND